MKRKITSIAIYPVKSLGGINLNNAFVERRGLKYDRRYMLVDSDYKHITQREFPILASVNTSIDGEVLTLQNAEQGKISVSTNPVANSNGKRVEVQVWNSVVDAELGEASINEWFSALLSADVSVVYMADDSLRSINADFDHGNEIVSFADGYPLLIVNEASLRDLNSRLESPLPVNRFRPNVVASGELPFEEDGWKRVRIGEAVFRITKPCARCTVTTVDQAAGEKTGPEPLKTLAAYRSASGVFPGDFEALGLGANDVLFGTNLVPETTGVKISIGDELEILD